MDTKKLMKICSAMLGLLLTVACANTDNSIPTGIEKIPAQVTDIEVTGIPGGAIITYQIPENGNILYVMAEYRLADGILYNKKASYYSNSITLEGFPDTQSYDVTLYTVSRSGAKSPSVTKTIVPLTPPYLSVHEKLEVEPTFGGMRIHFDNPDRANLKFIVITTDSVGDFYQAYTHYTKIETGSFSIRGFEATERMFGVYTLDRWNNASDTLFTNITPWFEEKIDKTRFVNARLPSDTYNPHMSAAYSLESLWDDVWGTGACFHTIPNSGIPQWFTIDLRAKARLSRLKFYHRTST